MKLKILYGIQCTGNGHLSRSKEIIKYLQTKFNEFKNKLRGKNEQVSIAAFYLGGAALFAIIIFIVKGIVAARRNRFCNRWERRMRRMPGFY